MSFGINKDFSSTLTLLNKGGTVTNPLYQPARVASILNVFLDDLQYKPTGLGHRNQELEDYMREVMYTRGLECEQLKKTIPLVACMITLCNSNISLEAKKNAALYMWFNIYIEERLSKDAQPFEEFGRRLLSSQPQLDPVLTVYAEVLHAMWKFYDPMIAALMFNSSLQFIAFSCLEPQIEKIQLIPEGDRFAWFIRDATGIPGYGLLNFTKEENFTAMDIIQALPYFSFWFSAVNDILSFHKEESTGETGTYIWIRSQMENKSPYDTCLEMVDEAKATGHTVCEALKNINPKAVEIWKNWERGYIEWHMTQDRYRLKELGFC